MKKVIALTGIRSEYDILHPIFNALNGSPNIDFGVIVSGAHLRGGAENTKNLIDADGFKVVDCIDSLLNTDRVTQRIKGVSLCCFGVAQAIEREKPDVILVLGDREEVISGCLVGVYMNIPVIHVAGGDPVYGNADDPIRAACSKLAHVHFVFTESYRKNLLKIGEQDFRVINCGNPALSNIEGIPYLGLTELEERLGAKLGLKFLVFIEHPLSSEITFIESDYRLSLKAVADFCKAFDMKAVIPESNTDPGSKVIEAIKSEYRKSEVLIFRAGLDRVTFINLMRHTSVLVGNSSMGLLECPAYGLPVVNIGNRQKGRLNAGNVVFVPRDYSAIFAAIENAVFNEEYRGMVSKLVNPFRGDKPAEEYILEFIESTDLTQRKWLVKEQLFGSEL